MIPRLTLESSGFAANAKLTFNTPEEFFLGQAAEPVAGIFDPAIYIKSDPEDSRT